MLEGDRYEVLDVTVRAESELAGKHFRDLPMTGALIGAIVRRRARRSSRTATTSCCPATA